MSIRHRNTSRWRTCVDFLEPRTLLTGTPVPSSAIPNIYNSVDSPMTISSTAVVGGQTLTVNIDDMTTGNMTIACSQATAVTVDGVISGGQPFPDLYQYGSTTVVQPAPDTGASLPFGSGGAAAAAQIGPGSHTVVFTISPDALTEGQIETTEAVNPDGYPFNESFYNGPWVVAAGTATGGTFSSALPFDITQAPYLEPVITKNTLSKPFINSAKLKGQEVVKITNAESVTDAVSKTIVYATFDGTLTEPFPIGELTKSMTLKPGKSGTLTVPIPELTSSLGGTYKLIAVTYDTAGAPGVSAPGPTMTVAQPVINLIPTAPTVVTARNGSAIVHYTLTNEGNITSSGVSSISFAYYPEGSGSFPYYLDITPLKLSLAPNKPRHLTMKLTASQVATLNASAPVDLYVEDSQDVTELVEVTI